MRCSCSGRSDLVELSQDYAEFVEGMLILETGDWIKLLQCPGCSQLWRTDEWDKYQTSYAFKLRLLEGWESTDMEALIKKRMIENHGGLARLLA